MEAGDKWYEHEPESALENEDYKILWDFSIQTDHVIEAWRLDLAAVDKKRTTCKIIDFAVPGDSRIKGALSGLRQFLTIESTLKMIKNAFYFTSKALFDLTIFKFLS